MFAVFPIPKTAPILTLKAMRKSLFIALCFTLLICITASLFAGCKSSPADGVDGSAPQQDTASSFDGASSAVSGTDESVTDDTQSNGQTDKNDGEDGIDFDFEDDDTDESGSSNVTSSKDANEKDKGGILGTIGSWFENLFGNKDSDDNKTTTTKPETTSTPPTSSNVSSESSQTEVSDNSTSDAGNSSVADEDNASSDTYVSDDGGDNADEDDAGNDVSEDINPDDDYTGDEYIEEPEEETSTSKPSANPDPDNWFGKDEGYSPIVRF